MLNRLERKYWGEKNTKKLDEGNTPPKSKLGIWGLSGGCCGREGKDKWKANHFHWETGGPTKFDGERNHEQLDFPWTM